MSAERRPPPANVTTIRPSRRSQKVDTTTSPVLVATIAAHPDVEMIGAFATLPQRQDLSRLEPAFHRAGGAAAEVLADPNLSRSPIRLTRHEDHIEIDASNTTTVVVANGGALRSTEHFSLAQPLILELAERIILVLEWRTSLAPPPQNWGILGHSPAIVDLISQIERVADTQVPVLVQGETGSGKERVARALHDCSMRAQRPFVAVNMSTLLPSMAGSQLFGHTKGAFSGADKEHVGLFEQANGGTLFLDEIGDTPAEVQPMLLRVLEVGVLRPIGSVGTRKVDVRVVAATDADLEADIVAGEFRAPLMHRLGGFILQLPPLRERPSDIGLLLSTFLAEELAAMGAPDRRVPADAHAPMWIPPDIMAALLRYPWPGNVRELRNVARKIAVLGFDKECVHLDAELSARLRPQANASAIDRKSGPRAENVEIDDAMLIETLAAHLYRPGDTAKALGVSRSKLYQLMESSPNIRSAKELTKAEIEHALGESGASLAKAALRLRVSERALKLRMTDLQLG